MVLAQFKIPCSVIQNSKKLKYVAILEDVSVGGSPNDDEFYRSGGNLSPARVSGANFEEGLIGGYEERPACTNHYRSSEASVSGKSVVGSSKSDPPTHDRVFSPGFSEVLKSNAYERVSSSLRITERNRIYQQVSTLSQSQGFLREAGGVLGRIRTCLRCLGGL